MVENVHPSETVDRSNVTLRYMNAGKRQELFKEWIQKHLQVLCPV